MTTTASGPREGAESVRLVDFLARELARASVTHMFGVGGANIEDLYDAVHRAGTVRGVRSLREQESEPLANSLERVDVAGEHELGVHAPHVSVRER